MPWQPHTSGRVVLGREAVRWLSLETSRIPLSGDGRARLALLTEPHSAPAQIAGPFWHSQPPQDLGVQRPTSPPTLSARGSSKLLRALPNYCLLYTSPSPRDRQK